MKRRKRVPFNIPLAIQTAWDLMWAANLRRRKEDDKYEKEHGQRPYGSARTYYITATDMLREVRGFAGQSVAGEPWKLGGYGDGVRVAGLSLNVIRRWLQRNPKLASHNFGKGHISGERYRPRGEPLAPAEKETIDKKAKCEANPRPQLRHYGHGTPQCVVESRKKKGQRVYGFRPSKAWTTSKRENVTCPRCLKLLQTLKPMTFIKKVELNDEHKQPINLYEDHRGWWWEFSDLNEEDREKTGPFVSPEKAYSNAQAYCEAGPP